MAVAYILAKGSVITPGVYNLVVYGHCKDEAEMRWNYPQCQHLPQMCLLITQKKLCTTKITPVSTWLPFRTIQVMLPYKSDLDT